MKFSIITPSFRQSAWLKLCVASVSDQAGVDVEHIVQDSCSEDDTKNWLPHDRRVKAFIEKDAGMYDAVNRGWRRAQGDVLAYLNCDEQYLPGALKAVADFFEAHPQVEVAFADTIVIDSNGNYICHRPSLVPTKHCMWIRFPVLTSSIFLRRSVFHERGIAFDTKWRDVGDYFWVREIVLRGVRMKVMPKLTSIFTDTGDNMNLKANAMRERAEKWEMIPRWIKMLHPFWVAQIRIKYSLRGNTRLAPFDYSIYTMASPERRVVFHAKQPTTFWTSRLNFQTFTKSA